MGILARTVVTAVAAMIPLRGQFLQSDNQYRLAQRDRPMDSEREQLTQRNVCLQRDRQLRYTD